MPESTPEISRSDLFSFATAELHALEASPTAAARNGTPAPATVPRNVGFDPYNTGGFDRNRAWSRVRRR